MNTGWELGEDVRDEDRLRQDELWADAIADGRAHVSHRELTMMYGPQFCSSIDEYKLVEMLVNAVYAVNSKQKSTLQYLDSETLRLVIEFAFPGLGPLVPSFVHKRNLRACIEKISSKTGKESSSFMICLRKRPLCHFEENQGLYDVCRTDTANTATLHEGKLARNGRQLSMTHRQYVLDQVFSAKSTNNDVCSVCVEPLLSWVLTPMAGHRATLLCFGQTGTGKTYTLYGALDYIACQLVGKNIRLTFYEVHGKKCYDLLNNRRVVHLRSDENEDMHVRGAVVEEAAPLQSAAQLMSLLKGALMLRSSRVTERNPISSRSHAVCSIEIDVSAGRISAFDSNKVFSKITLVDLAGSERNYETVKFNGADHKESAEINMALMALKNCFRAFSLLLQQQQQLPSERDTTEINAELPSSSKKCDIGTGTKPVSLGEYLQGKSPSSETKDQGNSATNSGRPPRLAAAGQSGAVRIPYRETLLTRVLKDCFTVSSGSTQHRTTIVATVSPTSTDLVHSVNTLDHVVKMSPQLQSLMQAVTVEVPMMSGAPYCHVPISQWSPLQVTAWLATTERGRFAQLVLPPNLDGRGLLNLSENVLNSLISQQLSRAARREAEGSSWVYVDDYQLDPALSSYNIVRNKYDKIGKALWNAIRRQQMSALALTDAKKRNEQQSRRDY